MSRHVRIATAASLGIVALAGAGLWRWASPDAGTIIVARRGDLTAHLIATGVLRPAASVTYRSPIVGRETEILELAPEGSRVNAGDLVVRLDTTELQRDFDRAQQELRQAQLDVEAAAGERQDAETALRDVTAGEGALTVEEARTRLQLVEKKVERLRGDFERLKPLLDKGFITRDELARTAGEQEIAEEELALARRRTGILVDVSHPRDRQRAEMKLAQTRMRLETTRARAEEAQLRLTAVVNLIARCRLYAQRPGLVVYEDLLTASPRRKIRVGDRVTGSQGLVTIPEIDRMRVEASVSEAEVHRVRPGQAAAVRLEAFPDARLTGRVARVGTMASAGIERALDDKRFDLFIDIEPASVELRPEMTARADIVIAERRDVLLIPVSAVVREGGVFVARVVRLGGVETRRLDLGEANDHFVEVLSGVAEHERIILTDATAGPPAGGRIPVVAAEFPGDPR